MPIAAMLALAMAALLAMALAAGVFLTGCVSDGGGASDPTQPGQGTGLSGAGKLPAPIPLGKAGG
jgi:hypothetical protein